jgi:hypothetical protein
MEQVAQWRQNRMRQQVETRKEEIKQEYAEAARERDQAIANNDMETAEENDNYCQNLEAEWQEYNPPAPPQQHPAAIRWREANRDFVDRLISKHGQEKTDAFFNAIDARLTAPKNLQNPAAGGMGLQRFSKEYFDRGKDFLELYSEGTSGVSYEPDATLTASEAARISGVSPDLYNKSAAALQTAGRYSWQNRK